MGKLRPIIAVASMTSLTLGLMAAPAVAGDQAGLDPGFGSGGIVDQQIGGEDTYGDNVARQGEKLVVSTSLGSPSSFGVVRFHPNGKRDTSFGNNGVARVSEPGVTLRPYSLTVQPDGKIVQVGSRFADSEKTVAIVVRYRPNGKRDKGFGANGVKRVAFPDDIWFSGTEIVRIDQQGRILFTGTTGPECGYISWDPQDCRAAIVRLTPKGKFDKTFGSKGRTTIRWGNRLFDPRSILVRSNGTILITGYRTGQNAYRGAAAVVNNRGKLYKKFGKKGKVSLTVKSSTQLREAAEDSAGRLVIAASSGTVDVTAFTVFRLKANGKVDRSFGKNGMVRRGPRVGVSDGARSVLLDSRGNIYAAGMAFLDPVPESTAFLLAKITPKGKFVRSFGNRGMISTTMDTAAQVNGMAWRSASSLVLSGGYQTSERSGLVLAAYRLR